MSVGSIFELHTSYFAWAFYDMLWDVMSSLGLFYLPFIFALYKSWQQSATTGEGEGRRSGAVALSHFQWQAFPMLAVVFFAGLPMVPVESSDFQYSAQSCSGTTLTLSNISSEGLSARDSTFMPTIDSSGMVEINDTPASVRLPLFFSLVSSQFSGVVGSVVKGMPCLKNISELDLELRSLVLQDDLLKNEYTNFANQCFLPSKTKFFRAMQGNEDHDYVSQKLLDSPASSDDLRYLGSNFYLNTPGFFKPCEVGAVVVGEVPHSECGHGFRATTPVNNWRYDGNRDIHYNADEIESRPGKPYCDEWWINTLPPDPVGLRSRLASAIYFEGDLINPARDVLDTLLADEPAWTDEMAQKDKDDFLIRRFVQSHPAKLTGRNGYAENLIIAGEVGNVFSSPFLSTTIASVGDVVDGSIRSEVLSAVSDFALKMTILKELAPMIQALLFLVIIIVLPLYLLISQFSIGGVLHYAIFFLVLRFFTVIWAVADVYQEGLFLSLFPDIAQWGTAFTYTRNRLLLYGMSAFFYIVAPLIMTNLVFLGAGNVRQFHIGGSTDINSKLGDK